jgi:hypothetical protein
MSPIEHALGAKRAAMPVAAYVVGGAALHFYTGVRVSKDIDAKLTARVLMVPSRRKANRQKYQAIAVCRVRAFGDKQTALSQGRRKRRQTTVCSRACTVCG